MGDTKLLEGQKAFAFGSCERSHEMNAQNSALEGAEITAAHLQWWQSLQFQPPSGRQMMMI